MFIGKIIGSVVATQKTESMRGSKLMMIEPYVIDPKTRDRFITTSRSLVAVDIVGAGEGQFVLAVQGSSARMTPETKTLPVDCTIIGVIDSITVQRAQMPLE
ncbi:MAG: EutN/CcmL family microcompartment protein [Thermoguttaceae bacterium]|jgi:ethanolamine utilization protein EutN|nr:EutN/CcmL family microcompartment protein [Thermoguttaceae bacterium]MBR4750364.1 EutN/CcmL family microcompartment protein [Thermoguttaceae bacterium]